MTMLIQTNAGLFTMDSGENLIWWMITFVLVIIASKAVFSNPPTPPPSPSESKREINIVMIPLQDRGSILNVIPGLLVIVAGILLVTGRTDVLAEAVSYSLDFIGVLLGG